MLASLKQILAPPLSQTLPYKFARAQSPRYKAYFSFVASHCVRWSEILAVKALASYVWMDGGVNCVGRERKESH